ncbi:MAG: HlyD family efflux transporter periplasmic adaptor subunit [Sphingomonadales bacterium]|nr:HlyD family efflux transporter periplasmic adaptor subunit [Sphingomonadales bacterium]
MATAFSRTTRALASDHGRGEAALLAVGGVLLLAWIAWFLCASVTVREASRSARVEVAGAARLLSAEQGGRLVASGLSAGRRVHAGDVLAQLDAAPQQARLAEAEARLAAYPTRLAALEAEAAAARAALAGSSDSGRAHAAAARARAAGAVATARFDGDLAAMRRADAAGGGSAPVEAARSEAEAHRSHAESEARRQEQAASAAEAGQHRAEREADVARADEALAALAAERMATLAVVEQLRRELGQRRIVAPADGVIGDVAPVRIGEVLPAGTRLATLVPTGALEVVAEFDAGTALGRIAEGQPARLRLDGFPWAQYGDLPARVARVAAEPNGERLRVELLLEAGNPDIPLRHGMAGVVDVAVEQTSPALLVLRAVGRWLA